MYVLELEINFLEATHSMNRDITAFLCCFSHFVHFVNTTTLKALTNSLMGGMPL